MLLLFSQGEYTVLPLLYLLCIWWIKGVEKNLEKEPNIHAHSFSGIYFKFVQIMVRFAWLWLKKQPFIDGVKWRIYPQFS